MDVQNFISGLSVFAFFTWIGALLTASSPAVVWSAFALLAVLTSAALALI